MSTVPGKSSSTTAADLCKHFEMSKDAQALLQPGMAPRPFLDLLIAEQRYPDAARFMAHAMPRREAIWWGCLCARLAYGKTPPEKQATALASAEGWVTEPTDEKRRAAYKHAEAAEFKNPAGLIGMAIFFSSGSIGPPGVKDIIPEPHLCPNAVGNAVVLAAVMNEPGKASERYLQFFALGFDVAHGKNRWKT